MLALALGSSTVQAWRAGEGPLAERLACCGRALAGIVFVGRMAYWKVIPL